MILSLFFFSAIIFVKATSDRWIYLMERESFRTDPGVLRVVLAVMEHFAVEVLVGVISGLFVHAIEFALRQEEGQAIGLLLFLQFFNLGLQPQNTQ